MYSELTIMLIYLYTQRNINFQKFYVLEQKNLLKTKTENNLIYNSA